MKKPRIPVVGAVLDLVRGSGKPSGGTPPSLVVVGLGNPGSKYANTRHNAGFWCIDKLAEEHSISLSRRHRASLVGEGIIDGRPVVLAKPRTFVNRSGQAIVYLLARFKISPAQLLVIYDDAALPLGKIRLRPEGSAGGHNGVKSIIEAIGTQDFPRLRLGIGSPPAGTDQVQHVLGAMSGKDQEVADDAVQHAGQAVVSVLAEGITATMNRFN